MSNRVVLEGGEALVNVHSALLCQSNGERSCAVHNLSDHSMREFPQHYREDRGIMERICSHGVGHPDPDDRYYQTVVRGDEYAGVHGCCGCCGDTFEGEIMNVFQVGDIVYYDGNDSEVFVQAGLGTVVEASCADYDDSVDVKFEDGGQYVLPQFLTLISKASDVDNEVK